MSDISREDEERHSDSSFDEADDQDWADWVDDEDVSDAQRAGLASGTGGSKSGSGSGNITYDPLSTSAGPSSTGAAGQGSFRVPTRALFADEKGQYEIFDSPVAALRRAKEKEGCDVVAVVKKLGEYAEIARMN